MLNFPIPFIFFKYTLILTFLIPLKGAGSDPFIIAGYYESWSQYYSPKGSRQPFTPEQIDPNLLTDIYYAFAVFGVITPAINPENPHLTGDFTIQPLYPDEKNTLYKRIIDLKKRKKGNLRVFLSIGGAHFNDPKDPFGVGTLTYPLFSQMVSSKTNRKQFILSAIDYAHYFGFDGIDIDWEFPGDVTRGGGKNDFDNFITFLKEASDTLHAAEPPLLLSFASPPMMPSGVAKNDQPKGGFYQWIAEASKHVDRIVVMAYNYHTPFTPNKHTGVNAPLLRDTHPSSPFYVAKTLDNFIAHNVPPEKLLLGIPIYGWSYNNVLDLAEDNTSPGKPFTTDPHLNTSKFLSYFEIADLITNRQLIFETDLTTSTVYAYNTNKRQWVSFDSPETTAMKVKEAKKRSLGGVAFWALNLDEYQWQPRFPNIRAAQTP